MMSLCACVEAAPVLFLYINIIFAVYSGAALSTSARLAWDPTLYAALREVWRAEYRAAAAALPALSALLLALPALAAAATLAAERRRHCAARTLLIWYWCVEGVFATGLAAWGAWTWRRLAAWRGSAAAAELRRAAALTDHLQPLLDQLAHWLPLPDTLKSLIQEAKEDLPRDGYVAAASLALLVVLLPLAAALALALWRRAARRHSHRRRRRHSRTDSSDADESKPLDKRQLDIA